MNRSRGVTLIELLVAISVIGILAAIILPAVNSSRESARRTTCQNNLRQISLGLLEHEAAQRHLPSGGWGFNWIGDPDRDTGYKQPGGWFYNILPYIELAPLSRIGSGLEAGLPTATSPKCMAMVELMRTPVSIYYCPSRRIPRAYSKWDGAHNCASTPVSCRIDYAGNGGDNNIIDSTQAYQPRYYSQGDDPEYWKAFPESNGVYVAHSELPLSAITDGYTTTYLVGEKYLVPDEYQRNGTDLGDNHSAWTGLNWDLARTTSKGKNGQPYIYQPPQQDTRGVRNWWTFGSAHAGSLNMVFCDGHIQTISYSIDVETHRRLGNRHDGLTIDGEY